MFQVLGSAKFRNLLGNKKLRNVMMMLTKMLENAELKIRKYKVMVYQSITSCLIIICSLYYLQCNSFFIFFWLIFNKKIWSKLIEIKLTNKIKILHIFFSQHYLESNIIIKSMTQKTKKTDIVLSGFDSMIKCKEGIAKISTFINSYHYCLSLQSSFSNYDSLKKGS